MTKENKIKEKISLTGYHPTETPEEIMDADKDIKRKEAFKEAYKKVMTIIPGYFIERKRKKAGASSGGTSFTQNIIVTSENAKVETTKETQQEEKQEEKGRERDD